MTGIPSSGNACSSFLNNVTLTETQDRSLEQQEKVELSMQPNHVQKIRLEQSDGILTWTYIDIYSYTVC